MTSRNPALGHICSLDMRHRTITGLKGHKDISLAKPTGTLHPLDTPAPLTRAGRPWLGMCDRQKKPTVSHLIANRAVLTLPWQKLAGEGRLVPTG